MVNCTLFNSASLFDIPQNVVLEPKVVFVLVLNFLSLATWNKFTYESSVASLLLFLLNQPSQIKSNYSSVLNFGLCYKINIRKGRKGWI